jgi:DNA-binding MarR family transcriptional regulator/N-acetylglutamate synthase-like GNAT family acetyltransferase
MAEPIKSQLEQRIDTVRRFNRFYTRAIGVLQEGLLQSRFSLTEVRVLYEAGRRERSTATELGKELGLDAGYLSRILGRFEEQGFILRETSDADGRQSIVILTKRGHKELAGLNDRSNDHVRTMLQSLPSAGQRRLVEAMTTIEELLSEDERQALVPYMFRPYRSGDMGWVVHRHGALYAEEYGWDERFEALVARIVADFIDHYDARRECCWIAERQGEVVGCVFLVKHPEMPETVAKLRLLLVEPSARGLGIGRHLVEECTRFARQAHYRRITLWTQSVLSSARHLYQQAGYCLVAEEKHHSFGHDLIGETWELEL